MSCLLIFASSADLVQEYTTSCHQAAACRQVFSRFVMSRIRYTKEVRPIRPYLGAIVHDDELYVGPAQRMPTLAAALVVQARQATGLTQEQLARLAGTSRSSISAIEHGKRDPGLEHLLKILTAAGFDLLTRIVPHDDHVLKASGARLDPQARRARNDAMREFADEMRAAVARSRPLLPK
jgi:transcriptional regulator with XRE-family HTH domain